MAEDTQFRVLLVDDHEIVRRGLKTVLQERTDIVVIGEAGTVKSGIEETMRLEPDIVLMDLRLPDGSGVEACREIRCNSPDTKVIILTSYADEDALFAAIMAGAAGYVLKDLDPSRLQEAIATVGRGGSLLDPKMTTTVLERVRKGAAQHPADDAFASLSPQEDRILKFIGEGLTNREIAEQLSLSEKTIKNYVSQIYSKLHIERRSQAATIATERRLRKEQ
ncbi:MAG: response regulator transcription factor [Dehalococcoidia bacterium]|jgi:DNA-binding NarL/FixJ family response regulator|nr:response regulator transcription factor [Dehalococcoidia bacterium]